MATLDDFESLVGESYELLQRFRDKPALQNMFGIERMSLVQITVGKPLTQYEIDTRIAELSKLVSRMRRMLGNP